MSIIRLQSNNGEIFKVDIQVANHLSLIKEMLENMNGMDDGNDDPILLPEVRSHILRKILEYCTYHKDEVFIPEDENASEKRSDDISEWDQEFLDKIDQPMLFDLIVAANYLDVKGLMVICCKHVANMIKRKCPDDIRATFDIQNDFTWNEMTQMYRERNE